MYWSLVMHLFARRKLEIKLKKPQKLVMNKINQTINNVKKIKCQIDLTKCMIPTKCFNTEWLADDTFSSTKNPASMLSATKL